MKCYQCKRPDKADVRCVVWTNKGRERFVFATDDGRWHDWLQGTWRDATGLICARPDAVAIKKTKPVLRQVGSRWLCEFCATDPGGTGQAKVDDDRGQPQLF